MTEAGNPGSRDQRLNAALLAFRRSPDRYQVARREPAILFAAVREVLQLAAGRPASGASNSTTAPSSELQDAARFFARTALFYPGADHYSLFGLPRGVPAPELKDRYRLLMRLIHPDYASAGAWPADTAVRVNRAYQVLSSPVLRREYDSTLAPPMHAASAASAKRRAPRQQLSTMAGDREQQERNRKRMLVAGAAGIVSVVLVVAAITISTQSQRHVQRAQAPTGQNQMPQGAPAPWPVPAPSEGAAPGGTSPGLRAAAPWPSDLPGAAANTSQPFTKPGPSLSEVQPLLARLLQQMESRRGESLLTLLDAEGRSRPEARALALHYDALVQDASQVRLSHVEYRAEPIEGGMLVTSRVRLLVDENSPTARGLRMTLRAEFASRGGKVVLTGLSGAAF